jgi:citronellyl-CoA dehydrogenase
MQQFQEERLWASASGLLAMEDCIQQTIEWAQQRQMFGSTLIDQQWVQFKLAELQTEVEALRALTYRAARCIWRARMRCNWPAWPSSSRGG